jgi:hypothetical protein
MISELLQRLNDLAAQVKKTRAVNINSRSTKQRAIDTGSFYFKKVREETIKILGETEELQEYDSIWQHLIHLAQGNNAKKTYERLIKELTKTTKDLNVARYSAPPEVPGLKSPKFSYSKGEQILIATLEQIIPSAAASYKQGVEDLNSGTERLSYRGTALEFREALRETLDYLAPDEDVIKEPWFKPETNQAHPTMKQKVRLVLTSRRKNKTKRTAAEKTVELIESLCADIARAVYSRASLSTHVKTSKQEVTQLKRYMDALFFDLLEIG